MPPKGTSEGFGSRNVVVGNTWSAYTEDQKKVFNPRYFQQLIAKSNPTNSTTISVCDDGPVPPEDPLTEEQVAQYLPIFKQLVNLSTVARDFKDGHLFRRSGKQWTREQLLKSEICKVVQQVSPHQFLHIWIGN